MNKPEFFTEYTRLCKGFRYESTPEQGNAWYSRLAHVHASDWTEAVTSLLCGPRFPLLDPVLEACEKAAAHRRRVEADRDRMASERFFRGDVIYRKGDDPVERSYNAMRIAMLRQTFQPGQSWAKYAQRHADGLASWISVAENARWAKATPMDQCQKHDAPHSVLRCITDELKYWTSCAEGTSVEEANADVVGIDHDGAVRCAICHGKNHEPGECWPWHNDQERIRRYALPFWQERIRQGGLDPNRILADAMKKEEEVPA